MLTPQEENIQTLCGLLGIDEDQAAASLATRVAIVASEEDTVQALCADLAILLGFTLQVVAPEEPCDIELAINTPARTNAPKRLYALLSENSLTLSESPLTPGAAFATIHGLTRKIAACYAAGYVVGHAIGKSPPDSYSVVFEKLGLTHELLQRDIYLTDTILAGAGGVGGGFLWAVRELNISGKLAIVDPKKVGLGNLNRCTYFSASEVGAEYKAEVLAKKAAMPRLELVPYVGTVREFIAAHGNIRRIITTVDNRGVRRKIQSEFPLEVIDASTTEASEIIVHSNAQPSDQACLSCIYAHIPAEHEQEQNIANALGLTLAEVQQRLIDQPMAAKLQVLHPKLKAATLVGTALDSLFKAQCGEDRLTAASKQAAAPFAFIVHLAGALLALELLRFEQDNVELGRANYMALNPWQPPHAHLRRRHGKNMDCEFCSKEDVRTAYQAIWPHLQPRQHLQTYP